MTLRDPLYTELSDNQKKEYTAFERAVLADHVRPRDGKAGEPFVLDKRNALLGHGSRETLRDPGAAGWPDRGRSTRDADEAERWARSHYIPQLWRTRMAASVHPNAGALTVADAAERYVRKHVQVTRDAHGNNTLVIPRKVQSRISMLRQHVVPAFGRIIFATLTRTMVREEAETLQVTAMGADGACAQRPAKHGHKLNFVRALTAVWNAAFPDVTAPFAGAVVRPVVEAEADEPTVVYDLENLQQTLSAEEGKGAMAPSQVRQAMIGAVHYDADLLSRPNTAPSMIANTVHLIVLLVATGARISELLRIRWCDIDFHRGFILIHQSKRHTNKNARPKPRLRITPLQRSFLPWLEQLRQLSGIADPTGNATYLIRSNPRAPSGKMGNQGSLSARLARALCHAGVKPLGKTTHWGRSTHASWGKHAAAVKREELQHWLGHSAYPGSTEDYVAMLIEMLRDEHRGYIALPTPDEVRLALADFVPALEDPERRRKPQLRTSAAMADRRQRRMGRELPASTADELVRRLFR